MTVGAPSSSVIVTRAPVTAPTPWGLEAEPVTVTRRSASSRVLFTAVMVTVSVPPVVLPAGMVIVASAPVEYAPTGDSTVMVVGRLEAWLSVAEIVVEPPFSEMEPSAAVSVTVGASSSSVIVIGAPRTRAGAVVEAKTYAHAVAVTVNARSSSSRVLSVAVSVTVLLPVVEPGGTSIVVALTVQAPATSPNRTRTRFVQVASRVTDTVAVPPFSEMDDGPTDSVTVGGPSSSVMVPVPVARVEERTALAGLLRVTRTVSWNSSPPSPMTVTVIVLLVSPAAKVSVPGASGR